MSKAVGGARVCVAHLLASPAAADEASIRASGGLGKRLLLFLSLLFAARMGAGEDVGQVGDVDVGVDLGCVDA